MVFSVLLQFAVKVKPFVTKFTEMPWRQMQNFVLTFSTVTFKFTATKPAGIFHFWMFVFDMMVKFLQQFENICAPQALETSSFEVRFPNTVCPDSYCTSRRAYFLGRFRIFATIFLLWIFG